MSSGWRLVLTVLLLIALPFKGLAAVGVAGCAETGDVAWTAVSSAAEVAVDGPCAHEGLAHGDPAAPAATAQADEGTPCAADGHGPCHHGAPCCVSLAPSQVPPLRLAELPRHVLPQAVTPRPRSVTPDGLERPPRA